MKKVLYVVSSVILLFWGLVILSKDSYAAELNNTRGAETIVTDEKGNVLEGIEVIIESEDYLLSNSLLRSRAVGHMVYRNVRIVHSNGTGMFTGSIHFNKKERGYTTAFTGTLYRQSAWSQSNGSWNVYYASYSGTVAAYLG